MDKTLKLMEQEKIVGVVRTEKTEQALHLVDAMVAGGLKLFEITCTVPDYVKVLKHLQKHKGVTAGAGTVTDMKRAKAVIEAGAKFIVTPNVDEEIIAYVQKQGCVMIPGAVTPTEILRAWKLGVDAVKVFPISAFGGSSYLGLVKGPLPEVRLMVAGEIELEQIDEYLRAGAFCLGVGSAIIDGHALANEAWERIADYTRAALVRVRSV
ncbi:MAG: bifunctional 4-hydroxy-2-oxoglutarate aldolase/2-dehydro-3-deoxy-phosphogluconate aldolase [Verrucomicrobia bacterium]|nr:bifunctional 4-hydroxy-2-oxoglutarate aldolase/2-dehydro-3-deoxy-phosphogluconate aldolase [Verrucomicrobiota bacterium]